MQQLVWRFSLVGEQNVIQLELIPKPNWESFTELAEEFCLKFNVQKVSLSLGADRAQLHFRIGLGDFLLHYESLCDSFWIDLFINKNEKQLTDLYDLMLNILKEKC
jgi:hypothetical protein